jgi:hypothetical protein
LTLFIETAEARRVRNRVEQLAAEIRKDLIRQRHNTNPRIASLYVFVKAYKSYQAGRLLAKQGFWQDAATVGRTVLELGFQARWLNLDLANRASLLVQHALREQRKLLQKLSSGGSREIRESAAASLNEVEALLRREGVDDSWQKWWSKKGNIKRLCCDMQLLPSYDSLYSDLCLFVHSSPFAANYFLHQDGDAVTFQCGAAGPRAEDAPFAEGLLMSLPVGLVETMAVVDTAYALGHQHTFDLIKTEYDTYYREREIKEAGDRGDQSG